MEIIMVLRKIYSRAERISRGEYPNKSLRVLGPPGETVRQVWIDYISKSKADNKPHLLSRLIDYAREKLTSEKEIDIRDELIKGIETKV